MWLSYCDDCAYEVWEEKPAWNDENENFGYDEEFTFCKQIFEKFFPRIKLKHREIRRINVVTVGRKQKAK